MKWFLITIGYCIAYFLFLIVLSYIFSKAVTGDQRQGEAYVFLALLFVGSIILFLLRMTGVL